MPGGGIRRRGQWVEPGKPGKPGNNTVKHTISTNIYTRNIKPNRNRSRNVCYRGRGNIWGQWAEPENPERGGTPMYTY